MIACSDRDPTMHDRTNPLLQHLDAFVRFARQQVRDHDLAADVVQEALTRALQHETQLRDEERVVAWFYRILRNTITDLRRRQARAQRRTEDELPAADVALPPEEHRELCACLGKLVETLRPEHRDLLRAVDLGDEEPAAAAARLSITTNNLNVRRHRARKALEEQLRATCRMCAVHGCVDCDCGP